MVTRRPGLPLPNRAQISVQINLSHPPTFGAGEFQQVLNDQRGPLGGGIDLLGALAAQLGIVAALQC